MKPEDVRRLYDASYAASYEAKFLEHPGAVADAKRELELLRSFLSPESRWLDVACGTGYFLRHFPEIERVGIDISPAMLERARAANAGAAFRQHDFRIPIPEWSDRFDLVSCMWYAYAYNDTIDELEQTIANLASWTSPSGRCFVPLADPRNIAGVELPYRVPPWTDVFGGADTIVEGDVYVTGIIWSYLEASGRKVHRHLLSPKVEFMIERFTEYFDSVELIQYRLLDPAPKIQREALVASAKRRV